MVPPRSAPNAFAVRLNERRSKTEKGSAYGDLCTKELDGVTCEQPFRGVTRFWSDDFATYEVRERDGLP